MGDANEVAGYDRIGDSAPWQRPAAAAQRHFCDVTCLENDFIRVSKPSSQDGECFFVTSFYCGIQGLRNSVGHENAASRR